MKKRTYSLIAATIFAAAGEFTAIFANIEIGMSIILLAAVCAWIWIISSVFSWYRQQRYGF